MKRVLRQGKNTGFTIVEVLIVLGVSAMILLAAIILVNGRQNDTEFTQAINLIQSQIQDTINDVANGSYSYQQVPVGAGGDPCLSRANQGTNNGCIFVGKAMQFGVVSSDPAEEFETYTIIGHESDVTDPPTTYSDASIKIPLDGSGNAALATTDILTNGLTKQAMYYCAPNLSPPPNGTCNTGANAITVVAFLSKLSPSSGGCSGNCPGGQQLYVAPINVDALKNNSNSAAAVSAMNASTCAPNAIACAADNFVPSNPQTVYICFASGTNNDSGLISLTNGEGQIAANLKIYQGNTKCGN